MGRKLKQITLIFIILTLVIQIPSFTSADKVGVVPAQIDINNILKEKPYLKSIRIINNGESPILYELNASENIATWITFYTTTDTTNSINTIEVIGKKEIIVKFVIPKKVANGEYSGNIFVKTVPQNQDTNSTSSNVRISFPIQVSLTTTGSQILTGNMTTLKTKDVEVGQQLPFTCGFINTGNVIATPNFNVSITRKDGFPIDNFEYDQTSIDLDAGEEFTFTWDTADREPGNYKATVAVYLGEEQIAQKNLTFELLPRGTLTREGELVNISYSSNPTVGKFVTINTTFINTGQVETAAQCFLEINHNGELIEIVKSDDEPIVKANEEYKFSLYYKIENAGQYTINAYVQFENNKTKMKTVSFEVGGIFENAFVIGLIILGIVSGGIIYYVFSTKIRIRVKRKPAGSSKSIETPVQVKQKDSPTILDKLRTGQLVANQLHNAKMFSSKMMDKNGNVNLVSDTKDDIIQQFISFDGIDESKATMLYEHGITSLEDLKKQTIHDLSTKMDIDRKSAVFLKNQLKQKKSKPSLDKEK